MRGNILIRQNSLKMRKLVTDYGMPHSQRWSKGGRCTGSEKILFVKDHHHFLNMSIISCFMDTIPSLKLRLRFFSRPVSWQRYVSWFSFLVKVEIPLRKNDP